MKSISDDLNNFSKIWEKALEQGVFPEQEAKPPVPEDDAPGTDFFGVFSNDGYDSQPLNECDSKYWALMAEFAREKAPYENKYNEERGVTKKDAKRETDKVGSSFNPVQRWTVGKDQEVVVAKNWGVGGKELNDLEELKKKLYDLEVKLGSAGIIKPKSKKDADENTILKSMADLKKQIDDLSDMLNGNRTDQTAHS